MTNTASKILVVDDEPEIRNMLSIFLGVEDFDVAEARNGEDALRQAAAEKPDLIVLDLGLPDMDGKDVIISLRRLSNVPIIVLTARAGDDQVVKSLELGANDYVTKPFHAEILLARINANLRKSTAEAVSSPIVENGPIRIDMASHQVRLHGQLVGFTPKEFDLLHLFVVNSGRMLSRKEIMREVWGASHTDDIQYLRVYIGHVRDKLNVVPGLGKAIVSEAGIGYRMDMLDTIDLPELVAAE